MRQSDGPREICCVRLDQVRPSGLSGLKESSLRSQFPRYVDNCIRINQTQRFARSLSKYFLWLSGIQLSLCSGECGVVPASQRGGGGGVGGGPRFASELPTFKVSRNLTPLFVCHLRETYAPCILPAVSWSLAISIRASSMSDVVHFQDGRPPPLLRRDYGRFRRGQRQSSKTSKVSNPPPEANLERGIFSFTPSPGSGFAT